MKIVSNGNFLLSTNDVFLGSTKCFGNNSIQITFRLTQNTNTNPQPFIYLKMYHHSEPYQKIDGNTNIDEMLYFRKIKINSSILSSSGGTEDINYNFNYNIRVNFNFVSFVLNNPNSINDLHYKFTAEPIDIPIDRYITRDKLVELDDLCLAVKNIGDFKTDIQSKTFKGISPWNMSAQGDLTNTEFLLYGDAINTIGYIDQNNHTHKSNNIKVKSATTFDTNHTGIGAHQIEIYGLNSNLYEIKENILLNGMNEVSCINQFTEINSARVRYAGNLLTNGGTIKIYNDDTTGTLSGGETNPQCVIEINNGISHNPVYCVPKGFELYIQKISINYYCEDECDLYFNKYQWHAGLGGVNLTKERIKKYDLHSTSFLNSEVDWVIPETQRFTITAKTNTVPTGINRISVNVIGYLKLIDFTRDSNKSYNNEFFISGKDELPLVLPTD